MTTQRSINPATGEQIQKYLDFVKHERFLDGYLTIMEDNPMPAVTGRVCYHPCEGACNRKDHDEPIGIRNVERYLGDYGLALADDPIAPTLPAPNGKHVVVVGAGPGGLGCAYHLRRLGYRVTILEAQAKPGGMLRGGIPHWHLPEEVLNAEITKIERLGGIEIRCNTRVGTDVTWEDLGGYDAAFLSVGQDVGRRFPMEGDDLRGVTGGLEFLREAGYGRPVKVGKKVLVIGGGNTASDTARSALRLGADEVKIVSLEARDELLIEPDDLEQAVEEGVRLQPGTACVRILGDDGVVQPVAALRRPGRPLARVQPHARQLDGAAERHDRPVAGDVQLKPGVIRGDMRDRFDARAARGAEDIGNVRRLSGLRQRDVCARPDEVRQAGRGNAEGARVLLSEQRDGLVALRHVVERPRQQPKALERFPVAPQGRLGFRASVDEIEDHARQTPPRHLTQIIDVDCSVDAASHGILSR